MPVARRSNAREDVAAKRTHPAVGVLHTGTKEDVEDAAKDGIAHIAVQPRHGARMDVVHPIADHEVRAILQRLKESGDLSEVVGEIGVSHHHIAATSRFEAGEVGAAIPTTRFVHYPGAGRSGQLGAAVV